MPVLFRGQLLPVRQYSSRLVFAGYSINPTFAAQEIYLLATNSFQTYIDSGDGLKYQQYRYILIPGGTAARAGKKIDWNNYNEVKAYLKLKD
jgi:hypothetical protein